MRVLITGSSGQLGSEIARQLAPEHEIVGIDVIPGQWTTHVASIMDRELVSSLVAGAEAVIHVASLHAPHVAQRPKQDFVDTNVSGTLHLLEASVRAHVRRFVYTSTTSVYGFALVPADRAVWVTEQLVPRPRDIYDITKLAAEELCRHFALTQQLPTICLRTSRFFAESPDRIAAYRLYRGADVRDIAAAHVLAATNTNIQFDVFNVSSHSPFADRDTPALLRDAPAIIRSYYPDAERVFTKRGWCLPASIDRVYVTERVERILGYRPQYNFREYLDELRGTHT